MNLHASIYITDNGIGNRQGSLYRDYADGKLKGFALHESLLTEDIIDICLAASTAGGGRRNAKILMNIKQKYKRHIIRDENALDFLILVVFQFGFMQGGKAVRDKQRGIKQY